MAKMNVGREGKIRFYDSTGTPYYFEIVYEEMDFSGPLSAPRPEEVLIMDRENINSNMHYVVASERAAAEPYEISWSCRIDDTTMRQKLRDVLNVDGAIAGAWTVGGNNWVTTKGDGSLVDADGNSTADPAFVDVAKACTNVEILWNNGSNDIGVKYVAVYFPPESQEISDGEEAVTVSLTGQVHGGKSSEITSFTAGNPS